MYVHGNIQSAPKLEIKFKIVIRGETITIK
jgi:hypothetical protein